MASVAIFAQWPGIKDGPASHSPILRAMSPDVVPGLTFKWRFLDLRARRVTWQCIDSGSPVADSVCTLRVNMETEAIIRCLKNDQFAARNDIELLEVRSGFARAKMTVHPHHRNGVGTVQGGAIFTLADFAFAAASNSHGTVAVAVNVSISFLKAGRDGQLWAEAREIACNPKLGSYTVEVKNDAGELMAIFQGMAYRKPDKLPPG